MNGSRIWLSGPITFSAPIGPVCSVTSVALAGSPAHIVLSFNGGLRVELDSMTAVELARRLPESLAKLPEVPDCAGFAWGGDE